MYLDGSRLFKKFYAANKESCGEHCVFFKRNHKRIEYSFMEYILIQHRIMREMIKNKIEKDSYGSSDDLIRDINNHGHLACQPERLNEKDFFSVNNFNFRKKVCDSLD